MQQVEKMSLSAFCILTIIFCYMCRRPPPPLRKKLDLSSNLVSFIGQVDRNLALYSRL